MKLLGVTFGSRAASALTAARRQEKLRSGNLMRALSGQDWGASQQTLLNLYKQYIRPVLETGSIFTAEACTSVVAVLQRIQNSALRMALRAERRTKISVTGKRGIDTIQSRVPERLQKVCLRFGQSWNARGSSGRRWSPSEISIFGRRDEPRGSACPRPGDDLVQEEHPMMSYVRLEGKS